MKFKVSTSNFLDIEFFQTLQDRFAEEFGIASIITDVNGVPLTKPSNFTDFCINHVRGCELGLKKCQFFDAYGGCKAQINKKPIIYPCHAGLIDFASPIIMGDVQVGCFPLSRRLLEVDKTIREIDLARVERERRTVTEATEDEDGLGDI